MFRYTKKVVLFFLDENEVLTTIEEGVSGK